MDNVSTRYVNVMCMNIILLWLIELEKWLADAVILAFVGNIFYLVLGFYVARSWDFLNGRVAALFTNTDVDQSRHLLFKRVWNGQLFQHCLDCKVNKTYH